MSELRINSERLHKFAARPAGALVVQLPRLPGAPESRSAHLLSGAPKVEAPAAGEIAALKAKVERLEGEMAELKAVVELMRG